MYLFLQSKNIRSICRILFVITGFIIGVMFFLFQSDSVKVVIASYLEQCMLTICYSDINSTGYLCEIIKVRSLETILIALILIQKWRKAGIICMCWIFSFFISLLVTTLSFVYGWKGIIICLLLFFPHGLVYISLFCFTVYKIENNGKLYEYKKNSRYTTLCGLLRKILEGLGIILYLILGMMMEGYFNLFLVQKMLPILIKQ